MLPSTPDKKRNISLLQYASLGTQFLAGIGMAVFIGLKVDKWINIKIPLLVWILPLMVIIGFIIKLVKETGKRK